MKSREEIALEATVTVMGADGDESLEAPERIGRYAVRGILGTGAMGVVYRAHDPQLDREVAIKLLRRTAGDALTSAGRARLVREAQAMARLSHPHVVTVFDAGEHAGDVFVAMELVPGRTLRDWLAEEPRPWREVVRLLRQAGEGLHAAHAAGLIHRDFKPANVLLSVAPDGRPRARVADFGLAMVEGADASSSSSIFPHALASTTSDRLTVTGAVLGTPAYMAPEQFAGQLADARADQFSFCVALYEGLHGRRPFGGETLGEVMACVLASDVIRPGRLRRVPRRIHGAVLRGLSRAPEARFPSMAELLFALDPAALTRRRVLVALGATGLAALGGVGMVARRTGASSGAPHVEPRPVTTAGDVLTVALSPDGGSLAYSRPGEVRLRALSGDADRVLLAGVRAQQLRFSPDGRTLLVRKGHTFGPAILCSLVDGACRQVAESVTDACFSHDGQRIVTSRVQDPELRVLGLDGKHLRTLPMPGDAQWISIRDVGAEGALVWGARGDTEGGWLVPLDGAQPRKLPPELAQADLQLAPGGRSVVYLERQRSLWRLVERPLAGGAPRVLADGLDVTSGFAIARDRRRVALVRGQEFSRVVGMEVDSGRGFPLRRDSTSKTSLAARPDGKAVAWLELGETLRVRGLRLDQVGFDPATGGLAVAHGGVSYAPDGRLALLTGTKRRVTVLSADGRAHTVLPLEADDDGALAWIPGPRPRILYRGPDLHRDFRIAADDGTDVRPLVRDPSVGWCFFPVASPDGKRVALYWNRTPKGLWTVDLETRQERFLLGGTVTPVGWRGGELLAMPEAPGGDGHGLVAVSEDGKVRTLHERLPFEQGLSVAVLVDGGSRLVGLSPDGVFDAWMLDDV